MAFGPLNAAARAAARAAKGGGKPPPKPREVAGPYRSQSSNPKIRSEATANEHRTVAPGRTPVRRVTSPTKPDLAKVLKLLTAPPESPATAIENAKFHGLTPPASLHREYGAEAVKAVEKAREKYIAEREGIHADPLAEFAISTAATAGLGAGAKLGADAAEEGLGALLKSGAARAGSKEATAGAVAAENALKAAAKGTASRLQGLPKQVAEDARAAKEVPLRKLRWLKESPQKLRQAPARMKTAASTSEGRKAAAKSAGRTAIHHPVRTGLPAAAALPPGAITVNGFDPGQRARAFFEGTGDALWEHPKQTLETTGHGALGLLTFPLATAGAAVSSAKQGNLDPLEELGEKYKEGTEKMIGGLASGDPSKVEHTTLTETGLTPFLPVPHVIKALKGSKTYEEGIRAPIRDVVEAHRAGTRDKRIAAEAKATEAGDFVPKKGVLKHRGDAEKAIRQSVADTARPGENYVLRRTGNLIEKQRSRHAVARDVARMQEKGEYHGKDAAKAIRRHLQKSKLTDQSAQNAGDVLRIFAKYGISHDEATGIAQVAALHDSFGAIEHGDIPIGVHLDRHATKWILDHPELFHDEHFLAAVHAFNDQAEEVGTSERNRYLASANSIVNPRLEREGRERILLPEERVPAESLKYLPKKKGQWTRAQALDLAVEREKELHVLRQRGDTAAAKKLEREQRGLMLSLKGLMKPPEHGGAEGGVSTTRAVAYTPQMRDAFAKEMAAAHREFHYRKPAAYVADAIPSGLQGAEKAPDFGARGNVPITKIWPSTGKAAASGNAESSFESLLHHSVEAPRMRRAVAEGLTRIFDRASRKVAGKRELTLSGVARAINKHEVPAGTIFVRPQMLKSALEGDYARSSEGFYAELNKEIEHGQKLAQSNAEELRGEIASNEGTKGEKYVPMDSVAIHELMGHFAPLGKVSQALSHTSNFATRTILNSPAFLAIQVPQEAIPLAAALGRNIVHVPLAIANLRRISKLPSELRADFRSAVGSSVGVLGAPATKELRASGFTDPIRAAGGYPKWRSAWNLVNGNTLGKIDRGRAGLFREIAADAKIHGDLKRAQKGFRIWRRGANNLFEGEKEAVKAMEGMSRAEQDAYVASHPRLGDKLVTAMNDMAGNWNSFTVMEKHFAPLTIFYPFQRYSVAWMLYHFPLDHPVVSTALNMLGQVNAQELQKIAAEKGSVPSLLDYTQPVIPNGPGKKPTVGLFGQRAFPGLSTLQQAALTDNPSQLAGDIQPGLSIPLEAMTGQDFYTGRPTEENGWKYALSQLAALSPAARFAGLDGSGKSPASKAYEKLDPLKEVGSFLDPFIGQTSSQFADTKHLEKEFAEKYGEGHLPSIYESPLFQKVLYGHNGGPNPDPAARKRELAEATKKINKSELAAAFIKGVEQPFYPPDKKIPKAVEDEIREAFENAWKNVKKTKIRPIRGGIGGPAIAGGIGGPSSSIGTIGGGPIGGGSIGGGSIGGTIGGRPLP